MVDIDPVPTDRHRAWGAVHRFLHNVVRPRERDEAVRLLQQRAGRPVLACGLARSYGDSCLVPDGLLIDSSGLDRFIAFEADSGRLTCEAGVTLADILTTVCARADGDQPRWFLPVTPGTKFVTIGGAIANDVHGKNHHGFGTFGRHVVSIELARSDGRRLVCSPTEEAELFRATIGGLGLTGLVLSATLQLRRVTGPLLDVEDIRFGDLDGFYRLAEESTDRFEYTVAWIDCLATGRSLGRGIFTRANHAGTNPDRQKQHPSRRTRAHPKLSVPFAPPVSPLNGLTLRAFNALYWRKLRGRERVHAIRHYDPVFYPLDAIGAWNRLYGSNGFYQYQCAVPAPVAVDTTRRLLETIAASGQGSFLAVLKTFGSLPSPGLLSFPLPGTTLALDFPNRGPSTLQLLDRLDEITHAAGGRIYPAKDGRVSAAAFQAGYPAWREVARLKDPAFTSAFWNRVGRDDAAMTKAAA